MVNAPSAIPPRDRLTFRRRHRLSHAREYQDAFNARLRKTAGPLIVFANRNGLTHPRLGLSVGRRVGGSVRRSRVKRMIREAFRLDMDELPGGFDFVVGVRPHRPLRLGAYRQILRRLAWEANREWERRERRSERSAEGEDGGTGEATE